MRTQIGTCIVFLDHVQNLHIHAVRARSLRVFLVDFRSEAETEYATGVTGIRILDVICS